jgi:hypothetical protein
MLYGTPGTDLFPGTGDDGAIWCSKYQVEADELCYVDGQGYGSGWDDTAEKAFAYGGAGDVSLTFRYWSNTERNYDFTYLYLGFNGVLAPSPSWTVSGELGTPTAKLNKTLTISAGSIPAGTDLITIQFRFDSDAGFSDQDGGHATVYGGFCCYDFRYQDLGTPANDDEDTFEDGPEGWVFAQKPAVGAFVDITPLDELPDPAVPCNALSGNVVTFFDKGAGAGDPLHPPGQYAAALSPVIDLAEAGLQDASQITIHWSDYLDLPPSEGVATRVWLRLGTTCPWTGLPFETDVDWIDLYPPFITLDDPLCEGGVTEVFPMQGGPYAYCRVALETIDWCSLLPECTSPGGNTTPWYDNIRVAVSSGTVAADPRPSAPSDAPSLAVQPNPSAAAVTIDFSVPATGPVSVRVFDCRGTLVRTLVDESLSAGRHRASWNGLDDGGRAMSSGVYWAKCTAGRKQVTRMMVLLK